jgi:hypothetical protein
MATELPGQEKGQAKGTSLIIGPREISDVPFSRPTIGIIVTNGLWGPGSVLGELEL